MTHSSLVKFLISSNLVSQGSAKEIAEAFTYRTIGKNELFLQAGNYSSEYLFLEKGFLRSFANDTEGNEVTTAFYGPGQVVFEVSWDAGIQGIR